eukprot:1143976-Pelagomonas_calceolata.AAC.2
MGALWVRNGERIEFLMDSILADTQIAGWALQQGLASELPMRMRMEGCAMREKTPCAGKEVVQ